MNVITSGVLCVAVIGRLLLAVSVAVLVVPHVARAATLQQMQSGTVVNTANGTQTVTISSVDITKSFLIFQTRSSGDRPVNATVRGRLASATTIEFVRSTNEGAPLAIDIQWYVATFGSGVTVQRGTATMSALTVDVAITPVAAMNQAFVLWSMTPNPTELENGADDIIAGDLTSTSNLQFRTNDGSGHVVWWQVVEFTNAADINVQRGTVATMTGATLSTTATLGTAVDVGHTFVLAGARTAGAGPDFGARTFRAQLTNSTTITFDRGIAGSPDDMPEISWQAVELRDGSTVQRGSANFAVGATQTIATLVTRVNTTRALAFASVQASGQSMGRTPYAVNDVPGVASTTAALTPTQLTLQRNSTLDTADVGWFVVQFAGGDGFKVGSFTKAPGTAPTPQSIVHGLGEVPKALILWTEGRSDERFSSASGITLRGASSGSAASGVLTLTINVPPGTTTNDAMVASIAIRPSAAAITPPAGWALVRRMDNGASNSLAIYGKVATASEPANYSWTFSASTGSAGGIRSFSGVDMTAPLDVENGVNTASSLNHAAPSVTTTSTNDMIVTSHGFASSASWTTPAGMTEAFDVASNAVPDALGISVAGSHAVQAAAGATGAKTATASNDADTGNTHTLALRAALPGTAYFGFGMTDGTTSRSVSTSSQDAVTTSNASTRMANKVLTMVRWGQVVVAEADLSSWNDTTFTLNWTTNDAESYVIHYIAIGGTDVSAKVVDWTMATAVGNRAVTGVGFAPDVVFHAHGGHTLTAALPTNLAVGAFGLGVMDFDGDQWAFANWTMDASGTSNTQRGQQTNAALYSFNQSLTVQKRAAWVSMDADGFTMNFSNTGSALAARVFSLALKGVNVKPGFFLKTPAAAPAPQDITGVGFTPRLIMLASVQSTTQANPVAHSRFGLGASDGGTEGSSAVQDQDAAGVTIVDAIDKTSKIFVKVDNSTPVVDAEADLASRGTDGFTLNWTTNDAVQTQILYLAMAPLAVTEVRLITFTATREPRGVHLAWRTGYEVDNLGFHLYREIDGRRTRITRSLVAGSGLMVGSRNRVTNEQSYSYWDVDAAAASPAAAYWLEDVDFNGKSTWHGPIRPGALTAVLDPVPNPLPENSPTLTGLGRGVGHREERFTTSPESGPEPLAVAAAARFNQPVVGVQAALGGDPREGQWALAGQPAVKIGVRASGWYRVSQPALLAAGLDPQVAPSTLRLYLEGVEQALLVTGAGDGHFDPSDVIEFYGVGVDTPSTDTAVYWLTGGSGTGLRVQTPPASPAGPAAPPRFWGTVERKDRSIYFAALRNGDAENWFGALISDGDPQDVNLSVRHPDVAAPTGATLEVILQGVTDTPDPVSHQVQVRVNGTIVGSVVFESRDRGAATLTFPSSVLLEGSNVVQLEAMNGAADMSLFDTLRLSYWHTTDADDDQLELVADAQQTLTIGGFSSSAVRVVDITDPEGVLELATVAGSVPLSVDVQTPGTGTRTLFAFTDTTIAAPAFVVANLPSSLNLASNAKDYLIISHADFLTQMAPLATLRATQGRSAAVVSIDDVYDEFGFGQRSPRALKDFLSHARSTWSVPPRYVVLAGDATFDPRDYAGLGFGDFVPTRLVDMSEMELETASDDWFTDINEDSLPDFAIGRLPLRTAAQANTVVAKLTGYDAEPVGAWSTSLALVIDTDDPTVHFRSSSEDLETRLPSSYVPHRLYRDDLGVSTLRSDLFSLVNQGQLIVNYLGHGSTYIWGTTGELLTTADVGSNWTTTGSRLPFVIAMNCLNGFFQGIYGEESLAETLLRHSGGAVAVWASSSLTDAEPQGVMNDELFKLVFNGSQATLGDAVKAAKGAMANPDVRRSWVFFGDPAMRLKGVPVSTDPPPAVPTLSVTPSSLNFGVETAGGAWTSVTPGQSVRVTQTGAGTVTWTASADQPWLQVTNGSGTGNGRFTIGLAAIGLPPSGSSTGTVTIAANGAQGSPTVAVRVTIIAPGTSNQPFGTIDTPQQGATGLSGAVAVTGWALDDVAVSKVQLFRDPVSPETAGPVYVGDAALIAGARPDVEAAYPLVPLNNRAGWGMMVLTNQLPNQGNGTFTLSALATDLDGHQAWLGSRSFTSDNANATKPFGAIDTPGLSEIASGTAYPNFGWTLTQQPKVVPFDGSTISVMIDGVMVGHPGALSPRPDIQAQFPGYANTDNAVGAYVFDTTAYSNGLHTIVWVVTDSGGSTEGIGSRYFTVENQTAPLTSQAVAGTLVTAQAESRAVAGARAVFARKGYDEAAAFERVPLRGGKRQVVAREVDRIELQLTTNSEASGWRHEGYLLVGGEKRPLPVGSTLDAATGRFYWQAGAGFLGSYDLLFVRTSPDGRLEEIPVEVVLQPRHRNKSDVLMAIDLPATGNVDSVFAIVGWAIDRGAPAGTGIDALHVWAYPHPGSGTPPLFLGVAQQAVSRQDVGAYFGERFADSAYSLVVDALPSGTYDLAVFPHSTVTGQFEAAGVVRITVK